MDAFVHCGLRKQCVLALCVVVCLCTASSVSGCDVRLAPFFRGVGGFVVEPANGRSVEVTVQRFHEIQTLTMYARDDGLIVELLNSSLCMATTGRKPLECRVSFTGIEDGGWYWVNGDRNAAVAPLMCERELSGGVRPLDPGGVETARSVFGTGSLFVHDTQGLMGIAPHLARHVDGDTTEVPVEQMWPGLPEMVVIPAGGFQMGCVSGLECWEWEDPLHDVRIPHSFAVSKYEVTFDEWDRCVEAGGCSHLPDDEGWGRGRRPVMNVSWQDAQEYVRWLARQTGRASRLLSEAEWEYSARARSRTVYEWGNDVGTNRANCRECGSQWDGQQTAPVGSFSPNEWGVYDMHGNLFELVDDCLNFDYNGAPGDGSAWLDGDCAARIIRGGDWSAPKDRLRSASRWNTPLDHRYEGTGLRIAQTLHRCERHMAPFFQGVGGFVARPADGLSLEVGVRRGRESERQTLYPRDDGLVVQLVDSALCSDEHGDAVECQVSFTNVEDGGWYWVNGERNAAVAPLVCEEQLGGPVVALAPGGVETSRSEYGTGSLFVHQTQGLMGIVPHLSSVGADEESTLPEMVVLPGGSFQMGCVSGQDCERNEEPLHEVTIPHSFAVSKHEVTFEQWDACVGAGGCSHRPDDDGWGRGRRPVIDVSWNDVKDFVRWLASETGEEYRLLSEAEWEYAVRAGSATVYNWGNGVGVNLANCNSCNSQWVRQTAPVGLFLPNAWGLYDLHGNVGEWVEDCWNGTYGGAPADGTAWLEGDCSRRVNRGGSWAGHEGTVRSASRSGSASGDRYRDVGFRVARTLGP